MNIEKTKSGYTVSGLLPMSFLITDSDYQQFREHFAKEIVEGLTDEMIDKIFKMFAGENSPEFDEAAKKGAKFLLSFITGSK